MRVILVAVMLMTVSCAPSPLSQPSSPLSPMTSTYFPSFAYEAGCLSTQASMKFLTLLRTDARQERPELKCNPALVRAAQARGDEMARSNRFAHCDQNGVCPNSYARAAGCMLPFPKYGYGNNIESIAAGSFSADAIFEALARSPGHATHLFGKNDFYAGQGDIGVAIGVGGQYGWWWSVLIGECP